MNDTKSFEPRVGSKLSNGATILAVYARGDRRFVLADNVGAQPFVTWAIDDEGDAFRGRFFTSLDEAAADLTER
jgi:hypothetical protein